MVFSNIHVIYHYNQKKILFIYPQRKKVGHAEEKKRELTNDERMPVTGRLEVVTFARDSAG